MALIVGAAILASTIIAIYFSPYQSCVRAFKARAEAGTVGSEPGYAELSCSKPS